MKHAQGEQEERERYRELLEEVRTVIPGAQVLFAFLLTVPFAARFSEVDLLGRIIFTSSTGLPGVASYHRLVGHRDRRGRRHFGVKTALAGLFLLALSITGVIFVVVRFMFESTVLGSAAAVVTALVAGVMWYLLPVISRRDL